MRKTVMMLVTLAGAAAFATAAQAGDADSEKAAVHADGGCGYSQAYMSAQAEAAEKAETRAKIQALIEDALADKETAAAATPVPGTGG